MYVYHLFHSSLIFFFSIIPKQPCICPSCHIPP